MLSLLTFYLINYFYSFIFLHYFFEIDNYFIVCFFSIILSIGLMYIFNFYYMLLKKIFFTLLVLIFEKIELVINNALLITFGIIAFSFYFSLSYIFIENIRYSWDLKYVYDIVPYISTFISCYYFKENILLGKK